MTDMPKGEITQGYLRPDFHRRLHAGLIVAWSWRILARETGHHGPKKIGHNSTPVTVAAIVNRPATPAPMAVRPPRPGTRAKNQRQRPPMRTPGRGHLIRGGTCCRACHQWRHQKKCPPSSASVAGKLDDQDRVFAVRPTTVSSPT